MIVKYIGHSCFLVKSDDNISVMIDPYKPGAYGGALTYAPITDAPDIVILSHEHEDHADLNSLPNQPLVVRTGAFARGIEFDVIDSYHDNAQGKERGPNRITCFELDGIRVCHVGDLGHTLNEDQIEKIGKIDLLFIPVGGKFTIGPVEATKVVEQIQPRIVIPMHFKTDRCGFPIEPVESFFNGKSEIKRSPTSEVVLKKEDIPGKLTYLYLPPSN